MEIPECRGQYLLNIALMLGPAKSSGFGLQPVTPVDIKAYCDVFKEELSIWEAEQLIQLAKVFVSAHTEYDGKDCAPPVTPAGEITDSHLKQVSNQLYEMLVRRSQSNKKVKPLGGRQT